MAEDATLTVAAAGVLTNDTDVDGNALTAVLVSTVSNGTLTLNANGAFTYVPTANYNGSDSFTYKANDGTADSNTVTVSLTITAVNDAPVVAMTAATLGYTTGDGAKVVDGGLTVADVDSVTLTEATVSLSAGFVAAQDALAVTTQNGITGSYTAATGVLVLSGSATVAHYQTALRSVTYTNSSGSPDTTTRTVSVSATDGAAASNTATRTITFALAPVVGMTGAALAYTENDGAKVIDSGLSVSDGDSANLASVTVTISGNFAPGEDALRYTTTNGITGSYDPATGVLTLTGTATLADYQAALRTIQYLNSSLNPSTANRTISVVARDGVLSSPVATRAISVARVNTRPVAGLGNIANLAAGGSFEMGPAPHLLGSAALTVEAWVRLGTSRTGRIVGNGATFQLSVDNGILKFHTNTGGNYAATVLSAGTAIAAGTWTHVAAVYDGAVKRLYINGVAEAGTVAASGSLVSTGSSTYVMGGTGADEYIGTVDELRIWRVARTGADIAGNSQAILAAIPADVLGYWRFDTQAAVHYDFSGRGAYALPVGAASLGSPARARTYDTSEDVALSGTLTGYDPDGDTFTFNRISTAPASGTAVIGNASSGGFTFTPAANTSGAASFAFTTQDGTLESDPAPVSVTVGAVNDPPVVAMRGTTLAYTENAAATPVDASLTVSDLDSPTLVGARVRITGNFSVGQDVLAFTNQGGITGSYNSSTGVLTLAGSATVAAYQAALPTVTYQNTSRNPSTAARSISIDVNDGVLDSNISSRGVSITSVNDAPGASADSHTVVEDGILRISAASGVLTNDTDAEGNSLTAVLVSGVSHGTLTVNADGSFTYTPTANYSGTDSFTYKANDGTSDSNTVTVTLTITAANDPPAVVMAGAALAYTENDGAVAIDSSLTVADIDSPTLASATVRLSGNFTAAEDVLAFTSQNGITGTFDSATGVLTLTGTATVAHYQAALRSVTYRNTSSNPSTLPRTISVTVSDGALSSTVATRTITIAAVNNQPTLDQPAAVTIDEDSGALTMVLTGIGAGGGESQPLTISAASGDASLFARPTVTYTSPNGTGSITFTPAANAFGSTSLTVTVSDGSSAITRTVVVTVLPVNDAPTLDPVANRSGLVGVSVSAPLAGISSGAANESQTLVLSAVSSNPAVLPHPTVAYVSPNGTGSLSLTPQALGTAQVTVTVHDGATANATTTRTFTVTIGHNTPPTITSIANMIVVEGKAFPSAAFTVGDTETPPSGLTVTVSSSNTALVGATGLAPSGSFSGRALTVTPVHGRIGDSDVTITVSDGELTASTTFRATVRPRWDYYLLEGQTDGGVATDIRITNPHSVVAPIRLTFVRADGTTADRSYDVPPSTRQSIRINAFPEAGAGGVSTFIKSINDLPLLIERTRVLDQTGFAGDSETALESTNASWYFADG
ncbi:tandem-95 repeat protein, partial [Plantibacter sp.]|uniref:beta strand repeat-containing protein n=1 Tax=Plantibacter sp. TaxID=1871045 RepID=UPI003260CF74